MAKITYTDKVSIATGGAAENTWRDNDANEVKNVVNENDTISTSTSNTLKFDKIQGYRHGSWAAPIVGNMIMDTSGAVEGGCVVVIWNGATSPTFTGGIIQSYSGEIKQSGTYSIYIHYLGGRFNVNVFNVDGYIEVINQFKLNVDLTLGQKTTTQSSLPQFAGVIKVETKINRLPTASGNYCFRLGNNQFRLGISGGEFLIGTSAGFDKYPIANLEGADLVATYDQAAGHATSLTWDGNSVTLSSTAGTKPIIQSGVCQIGGIGTTDWFEMEYLRLYDDTTLMGDWNIDEGAGLVLNDNSPNAYTMNIDVGTGSINTMWVAV